MENPDDDMTLEEAVIVLQRIASAPPSYHETMLDHGVLDVVAVLMNRARAHVIAQDWGCAAVWNLAYLASGELALAERRMASEVLAAVKQHPECDSIRVGAPLAALAWRLPQLWAACLAPVPRHPCLVPRPWHPWLA